MLPSNKRQLLLRVLELHERRNAKSTYVNHKKPTFDETAKSKHCAKRADVLPLNTYLMQVFSKNIFSLNIFYVIFSTLQWFMREKLIESSRYRIVRIQIDDQGSILFVSVKKSVFNQYCKINRNEICSEKRINKREKCRYR